MAHRPHPHAPLPAFPSSTHSAGYIKICVGEDADAFRTDEMQRDIVEGSRFTFNRLSQDVIKEEDEEEFCKVDYSELIDLRRTLASFKAENLRLVQESGENMQLFNNYMREMEQRHAEKNLSIESLKYKLKSLEERNFRCEELLKKAEQKLSNEPTLKPILKKEFGVQCELRTTFKSSHRPSQTQDLLPKDKNERVGREVWLPVLGKENYQMHKVITQLKQTHQSLTHSFEKEQLRKTEEDGKAKNIYYKTLTNSPRVSLKHRNQSILPDPLRLEFNESSSLSALISPRINENTRLNFFEANPRSRNAKPDSRLHFLDSKDEKRSGRSTCLSPSNVLQFENACVRRYGKQERSN